MLKIDTQAKILTAESKPYDFAGNQGTSHKVRLNIDGEIYVCKSTPEQVSELSTMIGNEGNVSMEVVSRKEALSLKLLSFNKARKL